MEYELTFRFWHVAIFQAERALWFTRSITLWIRIYISTDSKCGMTKQLGQPALDWIKSRIRGKKFLRYPACQMNCYKATPSKKDVAQCITMTRLCCLLHDACSCSVESFTLRGQERKWSSTFRVFYFKKQLGKLRS